MKGILSYNLVTIEKADKIKALNLILENGYTFKSSKNLENGDLELKVYTHQLKKYKKLFSENNIYAKYSNNKGLFSIFYRYRLRIGLLIGFFIMLVFVFLSGNIIWKIEIKGNYTVSDEEIMRELKDVGITYGTYIPKIDYDKVQNQYLLKSKNIAWISLNINGNVASVSVRETLHEPKEDENKYSNIVADMDGQIALISVIDGRKQVSIGDIVKKGEILISGVLDSQSQGVRLVNAKGNVKAYVTEEILVKIPFKEAIKVPTGNLKKEESIIFFSNNIKLYNFNNKNLNMYDIIEKTEQINLFDVVPLPIFKKTITYNEYEYIEIVRTKQEAVNLATKELNNQISKVLENSELISKSAETSYDSDFFYIRCKLYCIKDIAKSVEIIVNTK